MASRTIRAWDSSMSRLLARIALLFGSLAAVQDGLPRTAPGLAQFAIQNLAKLTPSRSPMDTWRIQDTARRRSITSCAAIMPLSLSST